MLSASLAFEYFFLKTDYEIRARSNRMLQRNTMLYVASHMRPALQTCFGADDIGPMHSVKKNAG